MKVKIDPTIVKAIEQVMNDCPTKYECRIVKRNDAIWYEFWRGEYRDFFIEITPNYRRFVVFKCREAQGIARDVARILHCKLIDPNDMDAGFDLEPNDAIVVHNPLNTVLAGASLNNVTTTNDDAELFEVLMANLR
jgi:hypothetical protein